MPATEMWQRRWPWNAPWSLMGAGEGGGQGGRPTAQVPTAPTWQTAQWFPELYNLIYGRIGTEQSNQMRGMIGQLTGNLAGGSQLSKTNVPIPAGADILARRYLSPLTSQMNMGMPWLDRTGQAMNLAQQFAPMFQSWWGQKTPLYQRIREPERSLPDFLSRLWGGGR